MKQITEAIQSFLIQAGKEFAMRLYKKLEELSWEE